ncbi:peroxide stress protein YaaA [Actinotalea sp.]|uniref:YaaA family protein n=1 Tax=Actinotalea sp. TaxID=1872145 RepID=UPI002C0B40B3|nr:peroxide stress protein YaaA [Actinotalea sp.]HQY33699.1 peroxide stress protein YaaA [Actinotalea sp.]HRA50880.1 peroxide stress protein YaaA [Actinotalea sp.]
MLLLLPPSEGKTAPTSGGPLDLAVLSHPGLTASRRTVLDALVRASARPDAAAVLGVGARAAGDVSRNLALLRSPTAEARSVYTGVLYAAAGFADLHGTALRRAQRSVRTVSALWGVLAPRDRVPAYRLSMGTDLPGVGPLAAYWRRPLAAELDTVADGGLVVDCRSAAYQAAWTPPVGAHRVAVRVMRERDGRRTVVSHEAKHTRGLLTGHLLHRDEQLPATVGALASAAAELPGLSVEVTAERGTSVLWLVTRA